MDPRAACSSDEGADDEATDEDLGVRARLWRLLLLGAAALTLRSWVR
jgi:hypothetical protein